MSQKSEIRFSIETRLKLANLVDENERKVLYKEIRNLLDVFEQESDESDDFEKFIHANKGRSAVKRTVLFEEYLSFSKRQVTRFGSASN